jgi:hypothetical protein
MIKIIKALAIKKMPQNGTKKIKKLKNILMHQKKLNLH